MSRLWLSVCCVLLLSPSLRAAESPKPATPKLVKVERTVEAMGTTYTIDAYGENAGKIQAAMEQAFDEVRRLDQMISNYIPDSELSMVNAQAADHPVRLSREFFELLSTCVDYSRRSEGSFDITVGPLMNVWGFYKGSGHLPHRAEVRAALEQVGYQNIELNSKALTVKLGRHGMSLDPGGVGKGLAVDRMVQILRDNGITSALVSGGGSSIYGIGSPPTDSRGWYVRIRDPKNESTTAAEVYLHDCSLSTSGNYEKFFWAEGKLYSHIMDPRTGYPSEGMLAVSVVTPKTLDSEIWAKPYYILGRKWAAAHKPPGFRVLVCEDKPGARCEWLQ